MSLLAREERRSAAGVFTTLGDAAVEAELGEMLRGLRADIAGMQVGSGLVSVVLGGGYGRGDGGVVERGGRQLPYNDLDFFVFTDGMSKAARAELALRLARLGEPWAERLGVEVDFAPAREISSLSWMPVTLMFQELRVGHQVVYGDARALAAIPPCPAESLPQREGLRLLLNRGTGLLLAQRRLAVGGDDEGTRDFVWRNLHKCALGCGDALLILAHRYDYELRRRVSALESLAGKHWPEAVAEAQLGPYRRAVAFKARPQWGDRAQAQAALPGVRQLWLDSVLRGLELCGCTVERHSRLSLRRALAAAGGSDRWWKNWLLNVTYGLDKGVGAGCFMPPQCWLLLALLEMLSADAELGQAAVVDFSWYYHRWGRFN